MKKPGSESPEAALITALRAEMAEPVDRELARRVRSRLTTTLSLAPDWGSAASGQQPLGSTPPAPTPMDVAAGAANGALGSGAATAAAPAASMVHAALVLVASASVGGLGLLGVDALISRSEPDSVSVQQSSPRLAQTPRPRAAMPLPSWSPQTVEAPTPTTEAALAEATSESRGKEWVEKQPSAVRASSPKPPASAASASSQAIPLAAQQPLLDTARRALATGHAAVALEALASHRSKFPVTALEQEREALTIKALRASGKAPEAEERARRFQQRYPNSVFLPSLINGGQPIP